MKSFRYLALLMPLFLTACALSPQQKADYAAVEQSGVSPAIYDKMVHGDDLSIHDVESLSHSHVGSGVILRYLRDQDTVYYLSAADVSGLQKAGVDPSVIDYMLQSGRRGAGAGYPYGPYGYGPYGYGFGPGLYGPGFYGGYLGFYGRGYYHHGYHGYRHH